LFADSDDEEEEAPIAKKIEPVIEETKKETTV
jgi:hypothetical protein